MVLKFLLFYIMIMYIFFYKAKQRKKLNFIKVQADFLKFDHSAYLGTVTKQTS